MTQIQDSFVATLICQSFHTVIRKVTVYAIHIIFIYFKYIILVKICESSDENTVKLNRWVSMNLDSNSFLPVTNYEYKSNKFSDS